MSIYTVQGNPIKHDNKWLAPGGTPSSDLPSYDSTDAGKVLKVNSIGTGLNWTEDEGTPYTAGPGIEIGSNNVISVDTSVVATQSDLTDGLASKQDILTAGQNITIDANNVISATGGGGGTSYTAGTGISISNDEISVDTSVVATQTDLANKQDTLTAGSNIQISSNVISATDTKYTAGTGLTLAGTEFSADTSVLATQTDLSTGLASKQGVLTAGQNITIDANNVISATGGGDVTDVTVNGTSVVTNHVAEVTVPTKTSDLTNDSGFITTSDIPAQVNADWDATSGAAEILNKPSIPTKTSDLNNDSGYITAADIPAQVNSDWSATSGPEEILNKPTIPSKTSDLTNDSGFITATDIPAQVKSDWNAVSGPAEILNKPAIPSKTSDLQNDSGFITSSDIPPQVNSDWNATSGTAEILNKPETTPLVAGTNITITETQNGIEISSSGSASQINADWNAVSGPAEILNKPTIPTNTSDLNNDSGFITASDIPAQVKSDWNAVSGPAEILNKPTIPTVPTTDQTYNASSTNPQSGTAVAGAIANVNQVPSSTQADANKVLTINAQGAPEWATLPSVTLSTLNTAGITDIQQVASLPASPVATVLYLIPET